MYEWLSFGGMILTIVGSMLTSVWILRGSIEKQFSEIRRLVYERTDQLLKTFTDKLEYHERHDDQRFNDINNNIWMLRIRSAAIDPNLKIKDDLCLPRENPKNYPLTRSSEGN